jgi:hypothetical protein
MRGEKVKTKRIKLEKGERAEINIRKPNAGKCDGKNTGGRMNLIVVGPANICIGIESKKQ